MRASKPRSGRAHSTSAWSTPMRAVARRRGVRAREGSGRRLAQGIVAHRRGRNRERGDTGRAPASGWRPRAADPRRHRYGADRTRPHRRAHRYRRDPPLGRGTQPPFADRHHRCERRGSRPRRHTGAGPLEKLLRSRLSGSTIALGRRRIAITVADGHVRTAPLIAETRSGKVSGTTIIDLDGQRIDSEWKLDGATAAAGRAPSPAACSRA